MTKFTLEQLEEWAKKRPNGYKKDILSLAILSEDGLYSLDDEAFKTLYDKYKLPSRLQMAKNLFDALATLSQEGAEKRPLEEVKSALGKCLKCPLLVESQMRCGSCGCFLGGLQEEDGKTKIKLGKLMYAAWHCPLDKW